MEFMNYITRNNYLDKFIRLQNTPDIKAIYRLS